MSRKEDMESHESAKTDTEQTAQQSRKGTRSTRPRRLAVPLVFVVLALTGACLLQQCGLELPFLPSNDQRDFEAERASGRKWAEPLELSGVPNLHRVSAHLYRGAQPTAEGMKQLEKLGVKTVVNLRSTGSDGDRLEDTDLAYQHIKMTTWNPEGADVTHFLRIVTDPNRTPVFVHCRHGADRTGTLCAIYRVAVQGWTKTQAIEEMTKGGFGYHSMWKNLVAYIRDLDVEAVMRDAGLKE